MSNDTWKLLGDERLPPVLGKFWSYEQDSWSYKPKQYNTFVPDDTADTLGNDYRTYIQTEKKMPHPLITARAGLSEVGISALVSDTLNFPDLRSETVRSKEIIGQYYQALAARGMLPTKVVY